MNQPDKPATRIAVLSLMAAYFAMGTGLMSVVGLLEPMSSDWETSPTRIALLLTVFSLTFAVAAPFIQVVFSHIAQRTLLLFGLGTMAIGSLGLAFSTDYATGFGWRIVMALGAAAIGPVATAIATALVEPKEQMRTLAILFTGMTLASVIGVPLATWIGQALSWQAVFVIIAGLAIACALVLAKTVTLRAPGRQISFRDFGLVFSTPATFWAIMITLLHMCGQFVCYALIAVLFIEAYGLPQSWLSIALFTMGFGHLLGNVLTAIYGDRFNADHVIAFSLIGMTVVFAGLWFSPPGPVWIGVLFVGWSIVGTLFQPPQQKRLIALNPEIRPLLLAMNASALYIGIAGGSWLSTVIYQSGGVFSLPLAAAGFTLLALLALYLSRRAANDTTTGIALTTPPKT